MDNAQLLQGRIVLPYDKDYKRYLLSNLRNDCKTTVDDKKMDPLFQYDRGKPLGGNLNTIHRSLG